MGEEQLAAAHDAELWDRSLTGDGRAFAALFDRHRQRILRYSYRVVEDTADADDVMAMAFLELWRLRDRVRIVNGSVLPWLLATTGNVARNSNRSRRRYRRFLAALPAAEHAEDFSIELGDALDRRTGSGSLAAALRELPPVEQSLLTLVHTEEIPLREAAEAVGLSYEAAKSRLQRARKKLNERLSPQYGTSPSTLATEGAAS